LANAEETDYLGKALADPLSELTRRERRVLLAVSALAILVADAGLLPSQISALGIEFDSYDQRFLYLSLVGFVFYFFATFGIYAYSDFLSWTMKVKTAIVNARLAHFNATHSPMDELTAATARQAMLSLIEQHERTTGETLDKARALVMTAAERDAAQERALGKPETWFQFWQKEIPASLVAREILDFVLPLIFGLVALWRVSAAWWSFTPT